MKKYLLIILCSIVLFGVTACGNREEEKEEEPKVATSDMLKFKGEVEEYNGKNADNGNIFQTVSIPEYNLINYATVESILSIANSDTGVVLFGFPTCPWFRDAVPILLEAALESELTAIHYINMLEIRTMWQIVDGKPVKTSDGHPAYYDLLTAFDSILSPYILSGIEVGEKRIMVPLVVFVKDGEIIGHHLGTFEGHEAYSAMTATQKATLKAIYAEFIDELLEASFCTATCDD